MNNWIPKNKTIKLSISAAFLSLLVYLGGLFFVWRQTQEVTDLYETVESRSSQGEKFRVIKSITEANQETIQTLRNFLVRKGGEVEFIEQIETVAKNSGVKFEIFSINTEADQASSLKENIKVKIELESSWKNIIAFIDKLEKLPFGVLISSFSFDTSGKGYWSGSVEIIAFKEK